MGKLVPLPLPPRLPSRRPVGLGIEAQVRRESDERDVEAEFRPVLALLFVASLARVLHALWRHESFDTEPTVALIFAIGLPWLAFRSLRKNRETRQLAS
jgi:Flp pilus assembly protein TadB